MYNGLLKGNELGDQGYSAGYSAGYSGGLLVRATQEGGETLVAIINAYKLHNVFVTTFPDCPPRLVTKILARKPAGGTIPHSRRMVTNGCVSL